jgi:superfamily I DNA/RNA helicase
VGVVRLEQNYRSTGTILKAANALIGNNADRLGKELWTAGAEGEPIRVYSGYNDLDEARFVAERIQDFLDGGGNPDEVAILYRSNAQSRVLEDALLRQQIPYRIYGGLRFFERAEIKNALAYLRLAHDRHADPAFERVVNTPTRGIGDKTVQAVREIAESGACHCGRRRASASAKGCCRPARRANWPSSSDWWTISARPPDACRCTSWRICVSKLPACSRFTRRSAVSAAWPARRTWRNW